MAHPIVGPHTSLLLIELSNEKFCSAAIMLGKTAEIVTSFEIEEDG